MALNVQCYQKKRNAYDLTKQAVVFLDVHNAKKLGCRKPCDVPTFFPPSQKYYPLNQSRICATNYFLCFSTHNPHVESRKVIPRSP